MILQMATRRITVEEARKLQNPNGVVHYNRSTHPPPPASGKPVHGRSPEPKKISTHEIMNEEDEDQPAVWEPSDTVADTLKTLKYFQDFRWNGKKSKKKEIRESYDNFDEWLNESVAEIIREEREKENNLFK